MLSITQLSIVVAANTNNPSILNPDFLKYNEIVPGDWEVVEPTVTTGVVSQVTFQNEIVAIAEPDKVNFTESIHDGDWGSLVIPGIAQQYLKTLPHVRYNAVGINPTGHIAFDTMDEARSFSLKLIARGPWLDLNTGLNQVATRFFYPIEQGQFVLSVEPAKKSEGDFEASVVVFAANFHRNIVGENPQERLTSAIGFIDKWKSDIGFYESAVNDAFFGGDK